jgi:hypothetical protein
MTVILIWGGSALALVVVHLVIAWFDDGSPDEWLSPWGEHQ